MTKKTMYQVQELKANNTWHVLYTYLVKDNAEKIMNMLTQRFPTREFKIEVIKPKEEI